MRYIALFLFMLLITQSCELGQGQLEPDIKDTEAALENLRKLDTEFVSNTNTFSYNLFGKILSEAPTNKNILVSPLSVNIALGMLYNGTQGNSATQIANTLGFEGQDLQSINANYRYLLNAIPNLSNEVEVNIANSVWYDNAFVVKNQFLENVEQSFKADVQSEDFGDNSTTTKINNWVKGHTKGKIDKIIDSISPSEVMLLINALYFNGNWTYQFNPEKTISSTFTNALGIEKNVQMMMHDKVKVRGSGGQGYAIFEMPYGKDEHYALRILLPHSGESLDAILMRDNIDAWDSSFELGRETSITVGFPKFEIKDEYELNDLLISLGIEDVFDSEKADLGNISDIQLNVSKVKHKTFMKVDEAGTEAAAVTSIGIEATSVPPSYMCDRPFAFYIYEREMNNILFMGRIVDID